MRGRLAIAILLAQAMAASAATQSGSWLFWTEKSPINSRVNAFAKTFADQPVTDQDGRTEAPALWVACQDETLSLGLEFNRMFVADSGDFGEVIYRVDRRDPRRFDATASYHKWLTTSGDTALEVVSEMFSGEGQILIRFHPFDEPPLDAYFNLQGIADAITPVLKNCHLRQ